MHDYITDVVHRAVYLLIAHKQKHTCRYKSKAIISYTYIHVNIPGHVGVSHKQ